jgi:BirA family transcriptional regulator, biotin operon repressor / biotin---[acetyl-CoA-carboxylase] ligase
MVTWTFVELDEVGSTQALAKGLAAMGAPEGTTVVARSQTSGEGRLGRSWASPPGGLYMSYVLRPQKLPRPELVSLVSATAVVRGVQLSTGLHSEIRWPNDIMVNGKKLAGVIAEAAAYKGEVAQAIVGVGLNCNSSVPATYTSGNMATSLAEELGRHIEVSELKLSILDSFSELYRRWQVGQDMVPLWKEHVATLGKRVSIKLKTDETPFSGEAAGVDSEGNLLVTTGGKVTAFLAADLEWLREVP